MLSNIVNVCEKTGVQINQVELWSREPAVFFSSGSRRGMGKSWTTLCCSSRVCCHHCHKSISILNKDTSAVSYCTRIIIFPLLQFTLFWAHVITLLHFHNTDKLQLKIIYRQHNMITVNKLKNKSIAVVAYTTSQTCIRELWRRSQCSSAGHWGWREQPAES